MRTKLISAVAREISLTNYEPEGNLPIWVIIYLVVVFGGLGVLDAVAVYSTWISLGDFITELAPMFTAMGIFIAFFGLLFLLSCIAGRE